MKKAHKDDPCRPLLERLPKRALVDLSIELMRSLYYRDFDYHSHVTEEYAREHIEPLAILLDIKLPPARPAPQECSDRCCRVRLQKRMKRRRS